MEYDIVVAGAGRAAKATFRSRNYMKSVIATFSTAFSLLALTACAGGIQCSWPDLGASYEVVDISKRRSDMKFLIFTAFDVTKTKEVAQAADKAFATPPAGTKLLATYTVQGIPWPGASGQITVSVAEAETNEALSAMEYPLAIAGATVWAVPVMEIPVPGAAEVERRLRG